MIKIYNRQTSKYEVEKVAGEKYIKWTYESPIGKSFLELLIKKKLFSKLYGSYCNTKFSSMKIRKFVNDFSIDSSSFKKSIDNFSNFNDFFARELSSNSRPIDLKENHLISPADGRVLAYANISINNLIQVKNITYSLSELINDNEIIEDYENGTCLVIRLCPTDYHRFHFIDSGFCNKTTFINGNYYSVNPSALQRIPKLYCQNKRQWSIFKSNNFDDVLYIEIGATCVGSIFQTYEPNKQVEKGDEKGYFKFGGSTVILFFKPNTINLDEDILQQSSLGFETKVFMGEKIGVKHI